MSSDGSAWVFVLDSTGSDSIVTGDAKDITTSRQIDGEARYPSLSPSGTQMAVSTDKGFVLFKDLRGEPRLVEPPVKDALIAESAWLDETLLITIVSERVVGVDPESDALDSLWVLDTRSGAWSRQTTETADQDNWTILRSIVISGDSVLFVRATGKASGSINDISYELWKASIDVNRVVSAPRMMRTLPLDTYVVGQRGAEVIFNTLRYKPNVHWEFGTLDTGGNMAIEGCGAGRVTSVAADPDLLGDPNPTPMTLPKGLGELPPPSGYLVLVRAADASTAADLQKQLGPNWRTYSSDEAPWAVEPGQVVVATAAPAQIDPAEFLQQMQMAVPDFADRFILSPIGPGG